jgi:formylmethanofuran dehydrogenase subunit A
MKNHVTIHMGASRFDVTVRGADGQPVTFDLYRMSKEERRNFHREFMKAYRNA